MDDLTKAILYISDPQKYDINYIDAEKAAAELAELRAIKAAAQEYLEAVDNPSQYVTYSVRLQKYEAFKAALKG